MKKYIFLLTIIALMSSCSVFKKSSSNKKSTKTEQTAKTHQANKETPKKIAPYSTCTFKAKTNFKGMPVTATIRTTFDSIFWVSGSSLGIEALRVKATRDSIYAIDKLNKRNIQYSYARASSALGIPLSFDFIQDLFTDTTLVKSYNTTQFKGTIVKKLTEIDGISLPEEVIIDGNIRGSNQKIKLTINNYRLNVKNEYPFDFIKGFKGKK